jgi:hypothetical protein
MSFRMMVNDERALPTRKTKRTASGAEGYGARHLVRGGDPNRDKHRHQRHHDEKDELHRVSSQRKRCPRHAKSVPFLT